MTIAWAQLALLFGFAYAVGLYLAVLILHRLYRRAFAAFGEELRAQYTRRLALAREGYMAGVAAVVATYLAEIGDEEALRQAQELDRAMGIADRVVARPAAPEAAP